MLVHADEEIVTSRTPGSDYVLTFPDGFVSVRLTGPASPIDEAAALAEQQRIDRLIQEGRKQGRTVEWR